MIDDYTYTSICPTASSTLAQVPCSGRVPESFLSGRWRGDAVRLQGAKDHPTATAERAQDLCSWAFNGHVRKLLVSLPEGNMM